MRIIRRTTMNLLKVGFKKRFAYVFVGQVYLKSYRVKLSGML